MESGKMETGMEDFGTFQGHILPGLVCLTFGFLWTYNNLFRYHAARREAFLNGRDTKKLNYESTLFSKYQDRCAYVLAEPYVVLVVGMTLGLFTETFVTIFQGKPVALAIHHILMYLFYALMALCAIFRHKKYALPPSSEHVIFLLENVAQGYLLSKHQLNGIKKTMHMSLSCLSFVIAVCTACEIAHRRSVVAALGRTLSVMAQGFWWCIIGFTIYPLHFMPTWDAEEHVKMEIANSLLVVDIAVVILIAFAVNFISNQRVKHLSLAAVSRIAALSSDPKCSSCSNGDREKQSFSDSDDEN